MRPGFAAAAATPRRSKSPRLLTSGRMCRNITRNFSSFTNDPSPLGTCGGGFADVAMPANLSSASARSGARSSAKSRQPAPRSVVQYSYAPRFSRSLRTQSRRDVGAAIRRRAALERRLRNEIDFVFSRPDTKVLSSPRIRIDPPGFDCAYVRVEVGQLLLEFFNGMGRTNLFSASKLTWKSWKDWRGISAVLSVIHEDDESWKRPDVRSVKDASDVLRTELAALKEAAASERWQLIVRKLNARNFPTV
jgi:hypothetical protein